jgi:hypothetical protein
MSLKALKDSEKAVTSSKMIQGGSSYQLLEIWKQLQKFVNWWPETIKLS